MQRFRRAPVIGTANFLSLNVSRRHGCLCNGDLSPTELRRDFPHGAGAIGSAADAVP